MTSKRKGTRYAWKLQPSCHYSSSTQLVAEKRALSSQVEKLKGDVQNLKQVLDLVASIAKTGLGDAPLPPPPPLLPPPQPDPDADSIRSPQPANRPAVAQLSVRVTSPPQQRALYFPSPQAPLPQNSIQNSNRVANIAPVPIPAPAVDRRQQPAHIRRPTFIEEYMAALKRIFYQIAVFVISATCGGLIVWVVVSVGLALYSDWIECTYCICRVKHL